MITGALLLIAGIALLLKDLAIITLWGINWGTLFLLIVGLSMVAKTHCAECMKCCVTKKKK